MKKKVAALLILTLLMLSLVIIFFIGKSNKVPEISVEDGITYMRFPVDKIQELPQEPDWRKEANAWESIEISKQNNKAINEFIQREVQRSNSKSFKYVNENGDIFINEEISIDTQIRDNESYFRSKNNNLVRIKIDDFMGTVSRIEYFVHTKGSWINKKYVCTCENINASRHHYFWKNGTLYYIVKENEDWKIIKVAKGEDISGFCESQNEEIIYPIIEKAGKLYVYVIENALSHSYAYYAEGKLDLREIDLSTVEGSCHIYQEKLFNELQMVGSIEQGNYTINLGIADNTINQGEDKSFSECYSQIVKNKAFQYSGGDNKIYMYWEKDGKNTYFLNLN